LGVGFGGQGFGGLLKSIFCYFKNSKNNMINDHIILQSHLIGFKNIYIVWNLKDKSKPSHPLRSNIP